MRREKWFRRGLPLGVLAVSALFAVCCGGKDVSAAPADVAGDYYIDLSELGMKLTIYLKLDESGDFLFSNTLDFEVDKSSGTYQESGEEYVMVYDSVNGEEKSISEGLTTGFTVLEDGTLDFSGENGCIYYGSARVTSSDPELKVLAHAVSGEYEEADTESDFQMGVYKAQSTGEDGVEYTHTVSFFEDNTFVHTMIYEKEGQKQFFGENGTYGVSTSQLALEMGDGTERQACEVVDKENLKLSVLPSADAAERVLLDFVKTEEKEEAAQFSGTGSVKGSSETFDVNLVLYTDGTYEATAKDFTETGVLVVNCAQGTLKQYPDHPESGVRGLSQVATVPAGEVLTDGEKLVLNGIRVRISEDLNRYACELTQIG